MPALAAHACGTVTQAAVKTREEGERAMHACGAVTQAAIMREERVFHHACSIIVPPETL